MGLSLPAKSARDDQHLVHEAIMLADQDGADLDLPRRFGAQLDERAEQTGGRRAQTAERLLLQPEADGSRQEIL